MFVDGRPSDRSALHSGQVVTIAGGIDVGDANAVADVISYIADVRGAIAAVDAGQRAFAVLGRTVRMTDSTVVDNGSAAALSVGARVEVSGYPNSMGELVATRVVSATQGSSAQLRGALAALDPNAHTFLLGTALVDYESATVTGALVEGGIVVVQGSAEGSASLVADRVDVIPPLGTRRGKGDVESLITSYASAADFDLAGQHVIGDEKTTYVLHGGALGPDAMVRVKGRFADNGTLVADKVELLVVNAAPQAKAVKPGRRP